MHLPLQKYTHNRPVRSQKPLLWGDSEIFIQDESFLIWSIHHFPAPPKFEHSWSSFHYQVSEHSLNGLTRLDGKRVFFIGPIPSPPSYSSVFFVCFDRLGMLFFSFPSVQSPQSPMESHYTLNSLSQSKESSDPNVFTVRARESLLINRHMTLFRVQSSPKFPNDGHIRHVSIKSLIEISLPFPLQLIKLCPSLKKSKSRDCVFMLNLMEESLIDGIENSFREECEIEGRGAPEDLRILSYKNSWEVSGFEERSIGLWRWCVEMKCGKVREFSPESEHQSYLLPQTPSGIHRLTELTPVGRGVSLLAGRVAWKVKTRQR